MRRRKRRAAPMRERPLEGVRVLDLSRIIAGPVAGRALAQHGADVLMINGPHLPNIAPLVIDNGRGKRSAVVDLREAAGRETLRGLAGDADVFLQAYRPGALAARGFGPEELARVRPGIVYVSVCAYGYEGPWAQRRGFRQPRAVGERDCFHRTAGGGRRRAQTSAVSGAGSCDRLSGRFRRDGRAGATRDRRRKLARARVARADRALAAVVRDGA